MRKSTKRRKKKSTPSHANNSDHNALLQQAIAHHQSGHLPEAEKIYHQLLESDPSHADANHLLGVLAYQVGKLDVANALISKALETDSRQPLFHLNLGNVLQDQGRPDEAITSYEKAITLNPDFPEAHNNMGNALSSAGRQMQAINCFKKAVAIRPEYAEAHNNLGNTLKELEQYGDAINHLRKSITLTPDYADAHNNLALALSANNQPEEAVESCRKAILLKPDFIDAHINLAVFLQKAGHKEESLVTVRRAVTLAPNNPAAHTGLANVLRDFGLLEESLSSYRSAIELDPDFEEAGSNNLMTMHYASSTKGQDLLAAAIAWAKPYNHQVEPAFPNPPEPDRRLRIGYISADFSSHPVGFYLERILPFHDEGAVEVICYSNSQKSDDTTERLRTSTDLWRQVYGLSDEALIEKIRADGIDILVDLSGHTAGNRLKVFARRPAPVQITWMGYTGTTGLKAIDYILADRFVLPEAETELFSENVKYLPGSYLCFDPPRFDIETVAPPSKEAGFITFGSFNNRVKITDEAIVAWAGILDGVSNSRLLLKTSSLDDEAVKRSVIEAFQAHGIDEDRLLLEGRSPRVDLLRTYQRVDIALDTQPFGGGVTTAEALWMGVPVITLRGSSWSGRLGETILNSVGLTELIADSPEHYHDLAIDLAGDSFKLERFHDELRHKLISSPFCNGSNFARKLEQAYREMWQDWISKKEAMPQQRTLSLEEAYREAVEHQQNGRIREAEEIYRAILEVDANQVETLHNLGLIIKDNGDLEQAVALFEMALSINPDNATVHNSKGVALFQLGRVDDALASYQQSRALNPTIPQTHRNIGSTLRKMNLPAKALVSYMEALRLEPDDNNNLIGAGAALQDLKQPEEAVLYFRKVLANTPDFAEVHYNLGNAYKDMGLFDEALSSYNRTIKLKPDFELAHSNKLMMMHYAPLTTGDDLLTAATTWARPYNADLPVRKHEGDADPDRRLRVGYVSADFSAHPVGFYLCQILPFHDDDSVEAVCYSNSRKSDHVTELLREGTRIWRNVIDLSDEEMVQQILDDKIDILVDLSGHTSGNRLAVFARRPAPVQVTWMGYTGTTGLKAIDYILADRFVLPENEKDLFSEKVFYLEGCYLCFDPPGFDIATVAPPARDAGYITFGSFNNRIKITPDTIASWSRILDAVAGSRMLLKSALFASEHTQRSLLEQFQQHGIKAERLCFEGRSPRIDLLRAYQRVDIILDTHPFGGGVTTAEALWMGVPVITLGNPRWSGRLGETILNTAGLPELVADSAEHYQTLAVELANDLPRLEILHSQIRNKFVSSPFCDGPTFTHKLEAAYRKMWRTCCTKRKTT